MFVFSTESATSCCGLSNAPGPTIITCDLGLEKLLSKHSKTTITAPFERVVIKKLLRCGAIRNLGHPAASFAFPHGTLRRAAVDGIARVFGRLIKYQLTVRATSASFLRCVRRCVWGTSRPQQPPPVLSFPPIIGNLCNSHTLLRTCVSIYCRVAGLSSEPLRHQMSNNTHGALCGPASTSRTFV